MTTTKCILNGLHHLLTMTIELNGNVIEEYEGRWKFSFHWSINWYDNLKRKEKEEEKHFNIGWTKKKKMFLFVIMIMEEWTGFYSYQFNILLAYIYIIVTRWLFLIVFTLIIYIWNSLSIFIFCFVLFAYLLGSWIIMILFHFSYCISSLLFFVSLSLSQWNMTHDQSWFLHMIFWFSNLEIHCFYYQTFIFVLPICHSFIFIGRTISFHTHTWMNIQLCVKISFDTIIMNGFFFCLSSRR